MEVLCWNVFSCFQKQQKEGTLILTVGTPCDSSDGRRVALKHDVPLKIVAQKHGHCYRACHSHLHWSLFAVQFQF